MTKAVKNSFVSWNDIDKEYDQWAKHTRSKKCTHFRNTTTHVGNGKHKGLFAFTLTKSPSDTLSLGDMLEAVKKLMVKYKSYSIKRYAWYYEDKGRDEFGEPIHPHIHGIYETESGGRIERKFFIRAWPIWDEEVPMGAGFRGGYHKEVYHEEEYRDYIKKDGRMHESHGFT